MGFTKHFPKLVDINVFVIKNCLYETIYEGYEQSSKKCISKLHLGLNIPIKF